MLALPVIKAEIAFALQHGHFWRNAIKARQEQASSTNHTYRLIFTVEDNVIAAWLWFKRIRAPPKGQASALGYLIFNCSSINGVTLSLMSGQEGKCPPYHLQRARANYARMRLAQSAISSPLLMSGCTKPLIIKVGDTWIPF